MNKKKLVIISLTAIIGIVIVPLLISAWYLLPPEIVLPRRETIIVYQGAISGQYSDSVELKAFLSETHNKKPITGRKIRFILEAQEISAITNIHGIASVSLRLNQIAKSYTILTIFPGDEQFHGSSDSDSFEILKENTVLTYTGPSAGVEGSAVTLSARLSELDLKLGDLGGKVIVFNLGELSVEAITNEHGKARADVELDLTPNSHNLRTEFFGSGTYLGSSDVDIFKVESAPAPPGECFIATAVFDSPLALELDILRQFRDEHLLTNQFGVLIVEQYERFSPFLANFIAQNENLRRLVGIGLEPLIEILSSVKRVPIR